MGALLGLLGLGGLLFGLFSLIRPTGRLGIAARGQAGWLIGGSFVVLIVGGALTPSEEDAPEALATRPTTTTSIASNSSSSSLEPTTTTTTQPTTTTSSLPSVPAAEVIFGPPLASASGDPSAPLPPNAEPATVTSITDGDTLDIAMADGTIHPVRLIGVNSPEGGECWGSESTIALATLVPEGSRIGLTADVSDRDQYDRLLRYVWVGGLSINEELVRRGAAISRRYLPDIAMASRFETAQADAKSGGLGLWAPDACGPPVNASLTVVGLAYDASGDDNTNLNEEWIRVRNDGDNIVDLTGWGIKDESASNRYSFPDGFTVSPGETITIHSGCGDDFGSQLFWCSIGSAVWNNDGDTAFLTDPSGNTHTSQTYAPPTTTTSSTTTTTTQAPPPTDADNQCHPSYQGECVPAGVSDVDCRGGSGNGPYYAGRVTVVGPDVYDLDRDGDGVGCEG